MFGKNGQSGCLDRLGHSTENRGKPLPVERGWALPQSRSIEISRLLFIKGSLKIRPLHGLGI
jgi:hypothetical protein